MAIIKCPECGHQISDKAPVCPSCGIEIAGKVIKCPNCGEIYFKDQEMCPNCHRPTGMATQQPTTTTPSTVAPPPVPPTPAKPAAKPADDTEKKEENKEQGNNIEKKNSKKSILIISFIFAVLVCGIMYYFYNSASENKEQEAYEYAMKSSDPMVLQSYLDTYKDADQAHRDSIQAHLTLLQQVDQDYTNAIVSGSKEALEAYLQKYPNSPHKDEIWNKIDSLDWQVALKSNTVDAFQAYLDAHSDGAHIEEAEEAMKKIKSKDLQPEERQMISGLYKQFFQSINSRNEDGLTATCEDILSSLLGKNSATKADVVTFMHKLYKSDVTNMNWRLNNDYQVKKREVGEDDYEYQVQFTARQDVTLTDGTTKENSFKIISTVSPDGKISSFSMVKTNVQE